MRHRHLLRFAFVLVLSGTLAAAQPQQAAPPLGPAPARVTVAPAQVTLKTGTTATLAATVLGDAGQTLEHPVTFFSSDRRTVRVNAATGELEALAPGVVTITARVAAATGSPRVETLVTVTVPHPAVASLTYLNVPARLYEHTTLRPQVRIDDEADGVRTDITATLTSSDPRVVRVTPLGLLQMTGTGTATLTATAEGVTRTHAVTVAANPTASVRVTIKADGARTGDVLHIDATALGANGAALDDMPIEYSFRARTVDHAQGSASSGLITEDGRFVADLPGEYTIVASAGNVTATETIAVAPRNIQKMVEVVGRGRVADRKTSDLWVWTAPNGRDYAVTGTWGADGHALFWDITDPTHIVQAATVRVDARTVNDVKVSEDGSICVISREGASNRRNGLVILDCSDIENKGVPVLSRYDEEMTGGVHNVFIDKGHIYALSAGQRYDIINIEDPKNPHRVGRFQLDSPSPSIHDVWVIDGVAVSSNWSDGVVLVDVGGGGKGGSPTNPVKMGQYKYPSGWNHAGWPFKSKSTGKFYVIAGDENFPIERNPQGMDRFSGPAINAAGWIHIIEFDDLEQPREVARYEVPEGGTHNFWIEDDILYVAYYNQGMRVVDLSGELLGNLYTQGREIAYFLPDDPEGFKPNAARTWGVMPFKGHLWIADNNSGLWAVKLKDLPQR
ncbi:MAG: Ig-like domain-containing protein [Acidobacteria bacterium]|nr:Ig-like domain-containing protein [Acidobacteriota bacterium]